MDQDSTTWLKVPLRLNHSHLSVSRPATRASMTGRRRRTVQTPARALYIFAYQAVDSSVLCSVHDGSMCREQLIQQPEQEQHWPDKFYLPSSTHRCLRLRGRTNQRFRSHALYEGIRQRHRQGRHRWGLVFLRTPPRHALMNMHQLVTSYTTSGRQQHGSDVLASDHTPPSPLTPPLSLFARVPKYCGLSASIDVFDAFHRLMYTGGTRVPDTT